MPPPTREGSNEPVEQNDWASSHRILALAAPIDSRKNGGTSWESANRIWPSLFLPLPTELYLEDGCGQDVILKRGWRRGTCWVCQMCCFVVRWETGTRWVVEGRKRQREQFWFDLWVNIYTFCLCASYISILQSPQEMHPPHQPHKRILSGHPPLFQYLSLTSSLSAHRLDYSAQLQREGRAVRSVGWGGYFVVQSCKTGLAVADEERVQDRRISSLVFGLSFTEYVCSLVIIICLKDQAA